MVAKKEARAISNKGDIFFSVALLPLTALGLGVGFYLITVNIWLFPSIIIASALFGVSCMGLNRMKEYKKLGEKIAKSN